MDQIRFLPGDQVHDRCVEMFPFHAAGPSQSIDSLTMRIIHFAGGISKYFFGFPMLFMFTSAKIQPKVFQMRKSNHFCRRSLVFPNIRIKLIPFTIYNHQDFEEVDSKDDDKKITGS
ncbi:MAG: hypothetical protein ACOC23_06580 [Thermodesulfobacteriota bacterium]